MLSRCWLRFLVWQNRKLKSLAVRLNGGVHPKHGLEADGWYMPHMEIGMLVLDLGAGIGAHARRLERAGVTVIAVDKHLANPRIWACDLEEPLRWGGGLFDRVLLLDVLEHIENRRQLLSEIHRVLKPGGLLFVSAPNAGTMWKLRLACAGLSSYADPDHKTEYGHGELVDELERAGFDVETSETIVYDTPLSGLIAVAGALWPWLYERLVRRLAYKAIALPGDTTGWRVVCRKE
jgi:SAM-dependent methyltransferase